MKYWIGLFVVLLLGASFRAQADCATRLNPPYGPQDQTALSDHINSRVTLKWLNLALREGHPIGRWLTAVGFQLRRDNLGQVIQVAVPDLNFAIQRLDEIAREKAAGFGKEPIRPGIIQQRDGNLTVTPLDADVGGRIWPGDIMSGKSYSHALGQRLVPFARPRILGDGREVWLHDLSHFMSLLEAYPASLDWLEVVAQHSRQPFLGNQSRLFFEQFEYLTNGAAVRAALPLPPGEARPTLARLRVHLASRSSLDLLEIRNRISTIFRQNRIRAGGQANDFQYNQAGVSSSSDGLLTWCMGGQDDLVERVSYLVALTLGMTYIGDSPATDSLRYLISDKRNPQHWLICASGIYAAGSPMHREYCAP